MKHPWWHCFFTFWEGHDYEEICGNYFEAVPQVVKDEDHYYCWICKKKITVNHLRGNE